MKSLTVRPKRRRFVVTMEVSIEVDERLIDDVLTDEWRNMFYPLRDAKEVASHLAHNLVQGRRLFTLDGFADQREDRVTVMDVTSEMAREVDMRSR